MTLDLGDGVSLELRIQVRDGAANVVIQANRPELIHQLNTHRAELAQALQYAGLDPELMQFGSHDESNSHPQDEREHDEHFDHDEPTDEQTWDHIPGRLYIVT